MVMVLTARSNLLQSIVPVQMPLTCGHPCPFQLLQKDGLDHDNVGSNDYGGQMHIIPF
jgi:hypothetical protein